MVEIGKWFQAANRAEWRAWLEKNHTTATEIWLVRFKQHTHKPCLSYDQAVEEALCFGWIDGVLKAIDDEKYAIRFSPRRPGSVWSETNKQRVKRMIEQGRMTEAGWVPINLAKRNGQWGKAARREDTAQMPAELKRALRADPKAKQIFNKLAPSHKKQFIYWIDEAKRDETRERRVRETIKMLRQNKRLGMP